MSKIARKLAFLEDNFPNTSSIDFQMTKQAKIKVEFSISPACFVFLEWGAYISKQMTKILK